MSGPQRFYKKPVEIEAMQWDGTDLRADELWEWTSRADAIGDMWPTRFAALGDDNSYEIFGGGDPLNDDGDDWNPDARTAIEQLKRDGYTAIVFDRLHSTWVHVSTGDWIIRGIEGEFYPCKPDIFAATYEAA